jgi:hypothetical protein
MPYQLDLRRDTEANRTTCTPLLGEPFFTTDNRELFIGDGSTSGGVYVASRTRSQCPADVSPSAAATLAIAPTLWFDKLSQRVLAAAGTGAYTYVVTLARTKALPGATVKIYVELPASTNPTIQIEDATGAVLLGSVSSPNGGAAAAYYNFEALLGPDGAWHKVNGNWIS